MNRETVSSRHGPARWRFRWRLAGEKCQFNRQTNGVEMARKGRVIDARPVEGLMTERLGMCLDAIAALDEGYGLERREVIARIAWDKINELLRVGKLVERNGIIVTARRLTMKPAAKTADSQSRKAADGKTQVVAAKPVTPPSRHKSGGTIQSADET